MDFRQAFIDSLLTNTTLTKSISILDYLPNSVPANENVRHLPYLQAYGRIQPVFPYYYEISSLASYCLLYTEHGAGSLIIKKHNYAMPPDTLAFIDCNETHRIEIRQSPWSYTVFFISRELIPSLYDDIAGFGYVHRLSCESDIPNMMKQLMKLSAHGRTSFMQSKIILDMLLEIIIEQDRENRMTSHIPEYLIQIKYNFDTNYQTDFSLDYLEKEYHISKYRICREFGKQYNRSPIQYLNYRRFEAAKETLISTDKRIHEIGQMVGFENTNLLIRLFKKYTGVTPQNYRKKQLSVT